MTWRTSLSLRRRLLTAVLVSAGLAPAFAQSFNIDVGATAGTNPTNAYPGAAAQPGFWNWVSADAVGVGQGLSGLGGGGAIAGVTIAGGSGNFAFNNPGTVGDEQQLMDDLQDIGGVGVVTTYSFAGLAPGGYWIYTYAWAPDDPAFRTEVSVAGAVDPPQVVGGPWFPGQRYLGTFALHFMVYPGGPPLVVTCETVAGAGSVNGFQLHFSTCDGDIHEYCTAKVNSAGCTPQISTAAGPPSLTPGIDFFVDASLELCDKPGLMILSKTGPAATPFGGGTLCLAPPIVRTPVQFSGCAGGPPCGGSYSFNVNDWMQAGGAGGPWAAGDSVWAQYWGRDPGFVPPGNVSLTEGVRFTVCF